MWPNLSTRGPCVPLSRPRIIPANFSSLRQYNKQIVSYSKHSLKYWFKMQSLRSSLLKYVRVKAPLQVVLYQAEGRHVLNILNLQVRACSDSGAANPDQIKEQVLNLVKKFDKIDATKVTESADFQKDLSLDSLDRVELVMAFEQEFAIEIPDEEADKLKCCADVAQYIISGAEKKARESS